MMARALPGVAVITGKKRIDSYNLAVSRFGSDVFILDDGFQHRKMPRDKDIVLLDYKRPISTGFPFPFGYLREFPSGLKRADIIVFTRADGTEIPKAARKYCEGKHCFFSTTEYSSFMSSEGRLSVQAFVDKPVWLVSGIARPKEFEKNIRELGAEVCGHSVFQDHHAYTTKELAAVMNKAQGAGAAFLITTEKDSVKIPPELAPVFIYPEMSIKMLNEGIFGVV
jgi:tetraacyldisaccharide 4'-kinase